jgi:hypothetical protein
MVELYLHSLSCLHGMVLNESGPFHFFAVTSTHILQGDSQQNWYMTAKQARKIISLMGINMYCGRYSRKWVQTYESHCPSTNYKLLN